MIYLGRPVDRIGSRSASIVFDAATEATILSCINDGYLFVERDSCCGGTGQDSAKRRQSCRHSFEIVAEQERLLWELGWGLFAIQPFIKIGMGNFHSNS